MFNSKIKSQNIVKQPLFFVIAILFLSYSNKLNAQICNGAVKSKYITIAQNTLVSNSVTNLKSHSVVSVQGGFWISGLANINGIDNEFYFAKFNDTGKLILFKTVGLQTNEGGFSIRLAATPSGGVIITGQSYENSINAYLAAVVSIDNAGNLKWYRKTPNAGNLFLDAIRAVTVDPNGDVIVAGDAQQYSNISYSRVLVAKLDSNGNTIFINQVNLSVSGNNQQAHPTQIQATPLGYLIGGWMTNAVNPFLLLIDKNNGKSIKSFYLNASTNHSQDKLIFTPSGKVYIAGFSSQNGSPEGWVSAIDFLKDSILWQIGISTSLGYKNYFNHAHLENDVLYLSMQINELTGGLKQGFIGIDTNGILVLGNSIYFSGRDFSTSNAGMDFDVLKTGGAVFFGQDNNMSIPHINLAILSPCEEDPCVNHNEKFSTFKTHLNRINVSIRDHFQGDFTHENPIVNSIDVTTFNECKAPEHSEFWLLNCFSPGNQDGFNDVFKIGHKGNNFYYDIQVFSRWGVLVYETEQASIKDVSKFWNGKVMNTGTDCPAGTYFVLYNLYVNGENNPPKNVHGVITLIRD